MPQQLESAIGEPGPQKQPCTSRENAKPPAPLLQSRLAPMERSNLVI